MEHHRVIDVRLRAALVWLVVSGALGGLGLVAVPPARLLLAGAGPSFADALVRLCATAALVAGVVLWGTATRVALEVLRAGSADLSTGLGRRPVGPVRRLLLAACGIALAATAAPAHADAQHGPDAPLGAAALRGLPLPDRPLGEVAAAPPARVPAEAPGGADVVVVRRGDSLWSIAAQRLGPSASATDLASYWRRVQVLNADTIGADPDLIHPGQTLRLPPA